MAHTFQLGDKVRFQHTHVLEVVYFTARVVKLDGEHVWLEVPERVRRLPFPPGYIFAALAENYDANRHLINEVLSLKYDLQGM
jgi:hypothetical protein